MLALCGTAASAAVTGKDAARAGRPRVKPGSTRTHPIPVGTEAKIGRGWKLRIDSVTPKAQLTGGEPVPAGAEDFVAHVSAKYTGSGSSALYPLELALAVAGPHGQGYRLPADGCTGNWPIPALTTASNERVYSGQSAAGSVCWTIATKDEAKLELYVAPSFAKRRIWFALRSKRRLLSFASSFNLTVGNNARGVAIADLNHDKLGDLITAQDSGGLSVLLGTTGIAHFGNPAPYTAGSEPTLLATGDLNRDGHPDVVVSNYGESSVSVLLGHANGTLAAQVPYETGLHPSAVALAPLVKGSQNLDLVVANTGADTISILLGKGDGTFAAQKTTTVGSTPRGLAIADFNHDGKLDIAVCGNGFPGSSSGYGVAVLLGNGNGTFQAPVYYIAHKWPSSIAAVDMNRDGYPDLVVTNDGSNDLTVLLNRGDGTFAPLANYPTGGTTPYGVAVSDFNGDGNPDVVVANSGSGNVSVLLGYGDGSLQAPSLLSATGGPVDVRVGDLNGDGLPDLAVADWGTPGHISVLFNTTH